jgi:prepilin-type N-terminal cleavage/methylation domain-containing protein
MKTQFKMKRQQRGFTLLEAALVVVVMGVVLTAIMVARNQSATRSTASEAVFMDTAVSSLFKFVKRTNRLPCPDSNGDGLEDATAGVCSSGASAGGIPYLTLEMSLASPVGTGLDKQLVYGVFRGVNAEAADLTLNEERSIPTPHVAPNASFKNLDDFKQALINATDASQTVDPLNLYVTGNDVNSGASNCAANKVANMAFVVAFAGGRNADEVGSDFDGPNLPGVGWSDSTKWASVATVTCFAGPGKPITPLYDDQVRAVSFTELMGVLSR